MSWDLEDKGCVYHLPVGSQLIVRDLLYLTSGQRLDLKVWKLTAHKEEEIVDDRTIG